jgi:hypothetical protein
MKKISQISILILMIVNYSCTIDSGGGPTAPACDNTTTSLNVQLFWDNASYDCPDITNNNPNVTPPLATSINYTTTASQIGSVTTLATGYLCTIVTTNFEPANDPNLPCSNPQMNTAYWLMPYPTLNVTGFQNEATNTTIDYYDDCQQCGSTTASGNARPHFMYASVLPAGTVNCLAEMKNMSDYTNANCQ